MTIIDIDIVLKDSRSTSVVNDGIVLNDDLSTRRVVWNQLRCRGRLSWSLSGNEALSDGGVHTISHKVLSLYSVLIGMTKYQVAMSVSHNRGEGPLNTGIKFHQRYETEAELLIDLEHVLSEGDLGIVASTCIQRRCPLQIQVISTVLRHENSSRG